MNSTGAISGKILVIDDNPIIQRTMFFALRDKGYNVLMCGEISEALKLIRNETFSAILLDLNFPPDGSVSSVNAHDGFWALAWLKRMDEVKNVPILVITSDPPEKSKAHALSAGASAYFQKPINKEELVAQLSELLVNKAIPAHA